MSDLADQAQAREEALAETLRRFGRAPVKSPAATGVCLNCGERLDGGRRWCSPECRDDWERQERAARRRGA
ncbi:MAG: hypothetical protein LBI87_09540 [Candidatus Accumulibacter sp.]|jgi:hypothetical protein|nr:hypothetical protein [Accumulibacter sp.]